MARGFDSKSVADQQERVGLYSKAPSANPDHEIEEPPLDLDQTRL